MEVVVSVALVSVLLSSAWAGYSYFLKKGDATSCLVKLRGLGTAFQNYYLDKTSWPEEPGIRESNNSISDKVIWTFYYDSLEPYGASREDWFCPRELRDAKRAKKEPGVDVEYLDPSYIPTPMLHDDDPFLYPSQPWLIERVDFHLNGRSTYMSNGSIQREFQLDSLRSK